MTFRFGDLSAMDESESSTSLHPGSGKRNNLDKTFNKMTNELNQGINGKKNQQYDLDNSDDNNYYSNNQGHTQNHSQHFSQNQSHHQSHYQSHYHGHNYQNNQNNQRNNHSDNNPNPLLDLFESTSLTPSTASIAFTQDLDYDDPRYGQPDTHNTYNTQNNTHNNTHNYAHYVQNNHNHNQHFHQQRSYSPFGAGSGTGEKSLSPAWVEGLLLNPLSAVQVAAATINPLGLESLGLGSWLDTLNQKKGVEGYDYLGGQIGGQSDVNPMHASMTVEASRVIQIAIRRR